MRTLLRFAAIVLAFVAVMVLGKLIFGIDPSGGELALVLVACVVSDLVDAVTA